MRDPDGTAAFAGLFELLAHPVLKVSRRGTIVLANDNVQEAFGYRPEELVGVSIDLLVPPVDRARHREAISAYLALEDPPRRSLGRSPGLEALRKDGTKFPAEIELRPSPDGSFVLATVVDVTEQRRAEGLLRESQERLLYAQRLAQMGFWDWNIEDNGLYWSHEIYRIFGLERSEFGASYPAFLDSVHPDDRDLVETAVDDALAEARPYRVDHRIVQPGGNVRWVHEQGEVTRSADGTPLRMVGTVIDITERKLLEDQVIRAQRMEAFGRLAGGIAHDFNNLLTVIGSYAGMLHAQPERPRDQIAGDIEQIRSATERAAILTRQLMAFARRGVMERRVLSLNDTVRNAEKILRRLLDEDIEILVVPSPELASCSADAIQLEQVLLNLALNARDAMPDGGTLTLRTENVTFEVHSKQTGLPPGSYACLEVSDTGCGMSEEVRAQAFEPFFTTKEPGKGTGLGLASCAGIIAQLQGGICVASEPDRGTTFRVYLPASEDEACDMPRPSELQARGGTENLWLVEDEPALRSIMARILTAHGYTVSEFENGAEALDAERGHRGAVDLLITDLVMPRMGGRRLREEFARSRPGVPVLFISGYSADRFGAAPTRPDTPMLVKPFRSDTLLRKVRAVLDR